MKILFSYFLFFIFTMANCLAQTIIDGYTDKLSYRTGETVTFFVNGTNVFHDPDVILQTADGSPAAVISGFQNMTPQNPQLNEPWKNGFGYSPTTTWVVPSSLKSGYYFLPGTVPIPDGIARKKWTNI